jgi:hypothetical protein
MASVNLSFRTPPDLMSKIQSRDIKNVDHPGYLAKRDLERWYSLLGSSLREVSVTPEEAVVVIFAAGWWLPTMTGQLLTDLPVVLRQEIGLDGFYESARRSLADRVDSWPLAVRAALWDAAERYDVLVHETQGCTYGAALHRVGLHNYLLDQEELEVVESFIAVESRELPAAYMNARIQKG